jgi:hypothetical protein
MPNQYTKFREQKSQLREFRWRPCNGTRKQAKRTKHGDEGKYDRIVVLSQQDERLAKSTTLKSRSSPSPPLPSLQQYSPSSGYRVDPFRAYAVVPNRQELAVLDYFLHVLAPSGKHHDVPLRRLSLSKVDPHISLLLPFVMGEPPLFDAMLATCQASISLSNGVSAFHDEFFMLHRGRAMAGLRKQLENDVDDAAILAVTMLITCDYLTGDIRAVEGHAKALQRMADIRSEMKSEKQRSETAWDKFVQHGLEGYKSICVLATGRRLASGESLSYLEETVSPFQPLLYPQPPFSAEHCQQWSRLPNGFLKLVLASQLSTQLIAVMMAVVECSPKALPGFLDSVKQIEPIQAALQRFSQHINCTFMERCIAAGLLAYSFQYPKVQIANMFHDPPMQGMIRLLRVPHRSRDSAEQNALVWVHMAVEGFLSARPTLLSGVVQLFRSAKSRYRALQDWNSTLPVLEQFFFTPHLLNRWRSCYESYDLLSEITSDLSISATTSQINPAMVNPATSPTDSRAPRTTDHFYLVSVLATLSAES